MKRGPYSKISREYFLLVWNDSTSLSEVASRLCISKRAAECRAYHLRKRGVDVRRFVNGFDAWDQDHLLAVRRENGRRVTMTSEKARWMRSRVKTPHVITPEERAKGVMLRRERCEILRVLKRERR